MTDAATRPATVRPLSRAPSPAAVGAGLALGLVTAMLLRIRTTPDVDLWLHLRIGQLLNEGVQFGAGPDPLAVLADRPYLPTQWLAQRTMAWTWSIAGMTGIQVMRLLLVLALGAAVVATCRLVAPPAAAGFAAALTMFGAAAAWGERPQLLGLVLFAVVALLWWRSTLHGRVPWPVIPLTWFWATVHGTWVLGIVAGAALLCGAVADRRLTWRTVMWGVVVLAGSVAAAALTPLGPKVVVEPFTVGRLATQYVNEWAAPTLDNPVFVVVLGAAGLSVVGLFRSPRHRWTRLASVVLGVALSVWMVRTIAFGSVLLAPALAHTFATLRGSTTPARHRHEWVVWALAAATLAVLGGWHVASTPFGPPVSARVADALATTPADARLAVDGHAVGWVQWAHPDRRPMFDLRAEVYSDSVSSAYRSFADAEPGWESYASGQQIRTILTQRDSPLDLALAGTADWTSVADDDEFRLWRAPEGVGAP